MTNTDGDTLIPKCLIPGTDGNTQCLGHSAEGYLTPCCWLGMRSPRLGIAEDIFFQDKLKISNNDSIFDIIYSKEWIDFFNLLLETPEKAPKICYAKCGTNAEPLTVRDLP